MNGMPLFHRSPRTLPVPPTEDQPPPPVPARPTSSLVVVPASPVIAVLAWTEKVGTATGGGMTHVL